MASHVQMAACLAQWAVPRMIRESVRWSEWEELPFVPPPHPHHRKSNKTVQSFCCQAQELPSPPSVSSIADWHSRRRDAALPPVSLLHKLTVTVSLSSGRLILLSRCLFQRCPSGWQLAQRDNKLSLSWRLHHQMCPCHPGGSGRMAWWALWFVTCCGLNERNELVKEMSTSWMRSVGCTFRLSRKLHLTTYRREHWEARLGATTEWMALCQLLCHQAHSLLVSLICPSPFSLSPSLTHPPPLVCSLHKLRTPSPFFLL